MIQGSCCCGAVRFRLDQAPKIVGACHCSRCRKLGATPFAIVDAASVEILEGRERISEYRPGAPHKYTRCFCSECGSSLGEITSAEKSFPIPVNCFDGDVEVVIRFHEHVATKPSWTVIPEGVKQFQGDPG